MEAECCVVCAEPLAFVAKGPCGHADACAECAVRLRAVLGDRRCCLCQVEAEAVLATRHMGKFTAPFPAGGVSEMHARARAGELWFLEAAGVFFDDPVAFREMESRCAVQCGECGERLPSVAALKRHALKAHGKELCGVCLEGRKVFANEQLLYTKEELKRHMAVGDAEGPLAEAGFKGHPKCQFCNKHFYGEAELFSHMETQHYRCFICQKERPDTYTYYKDVPELIAHFRSSHFYCDHPDCLDKHPEERAFATENDVKNHYGLVHAGHMSRDERKAFLRVQTNFEFTRPGEVPGGRGGRERGGGRGGGGRGAGGRGRDAAGAAATPASAAPAAAAAPQRPPEAEDFPEFSSSSAGAAQASSGRWGGNVAAAPQRASLTAQDFPSLGPGAPRSARARKKQLQKRQQGQDSAPAAPAAPHHGDLPAVDASSRMRQPGGASTSMAGRLGANAAASAPGSARVLHRSTAAGSWGRAISGAPPTVHFGGADFPGLGGPGPSTSRGAEWAETGAAAAPRAVAPRPQRAMWTCGTCTLKNPVGINTCQACGEFCPEGAAEPRGQPAPRQQPHNHPPQPGASWPGLPANAGPGPNGIMGKGPTTSWTRAHGKKKKGRSPAEMPAAAAEVLSQPGSSAGAGSSSFFEAPVRASWTCGFCGRRNPSGIRTCQNENCGEFCPESDPAPAPSRDYANRTGGNPHGGKLEVADFPGLPQAPKPQKVKKKKKGKAANLLQDPCELLVQDSGGEMAQPTHSGSQEPGKKGKKGKQAKFERLRIGTAPYMPEATPRRTNPGNSWTQGSGNGLF